MAFEDAAKDKEFETRFAALLKLLSPDNNRPIVFYCLGRDSWFSVNAAMRAKKMGYSQVGWYRGGFESWKAAKLPTGSVVVRAVAN
jgi:rhodanese-related sulfurtransferase